MKKKIALLLALVMMLALCACGKKVEFSEKGEIALNKVRVLQSYMKAPDTFILRDDVLVLNADNNKTWVYISYSAENSFGVPLRDMAVFYDGEYLGSYYDIEDELEEAKNGPLLQREDYSSDEEFHEANENIIIKAQCGLYFASWKLGEVDDYEVVSCEDIAKELGIEYQEK